MASNETPDIREYMVKADGAQATVGFSALEDFRVASDRKAYERYQAELFDERMRGQSVKNGTLEKSQISTTIAFAIAAQVKDEKSILEKRKRANDEFLLLDMLQQIREDIDRLETSIADRYGENFAEDMLAELTEQGHIDQAEHDRIMAIEDETERRQAIAKLVQDKLDSGEITMADLNKSYPWAKEWLDMRAQERETKQKLGKDYLDNNASANELDIDSADFAKNQIDTDVAKKDKAEELIDAAADSKADEVVRTVSLSGFGLD